MMNILFYMLFVYFFLKYYFYDEYSRYFTQYCRLLHVQKSCNVVDAHFRSKESKEFLVWFLVYRESLLLYPLKKKAIKKMKKKALRKYRKKINSLDTKIIRLLCKRYRCVQRIGRIKRENGMPLVDQKREDAIMAKIESRTDDKKTGLYIKSIYRAVFQASYSVEEKE